MTYHQIAACNDPAAISLSTANRDFIPQLCHLQLNSFDIFSGFHRGNLSLPKCLTSLRLANSAGIGRISLAFDRWVRHLDVQNEFTIEAIEAPLVEKNFFCRRRGRQEFAPVHFKADFL